MDSMDMRDTNLPANGAQSAEAAPVALETEHDAGTRAAAEKRELRNKKRTQRTEIPATRTERDKHGLDAAVAAQKKQWKRRVTTLIVWLVVLAVLGAGGWFLYQSLTAGAEGESQETYLVSAISEGEINSVISGSGSLSSIKASSVTAAADATVETVEKKSGDAVAKGETVLTLSSSAVNSQLDDLADSLADIQDEIADTTQLRTGSKLLITGGVAGVVKDVRAAVGDAVDDLPYLCLISTDGKMKVEIDATDGMRAYDAVTVDIGGAREDGFVYYITNGVAGVVIDKNSYDMGAAAAVYGTDGTLLGEGTLSVNEYVEVTAAAGVIDAVSVIENQKVGKSRTLFKLKKGAPTDAYMELKEAESDLLDQIQDLKDALTVVAEWDGYITSMAVEKGDEVTAGTELCALASSDGFTMSLSIDELDISSVQHGQDVSITLDALEGTFSGKVTNISYAGSGSYVTTYTATIVTDPIEGAYPGMSASAEIITETSGTRMIVQVVAVQYSGRGDERESYVYLAPDGASARQKLAKAEVNTDTLTKIMVTTGMSDGSYIVIESDELASGDLILVPQTTTTATYTESQSTTTTFSGMSGMPSGDFSGMPSGDFVPPSGNFGGGNFGGGNASGRPQG